MPDLAGKKAGALAGSAGEAEINKVDPKALVRFESVPSMFAALATQPSEIDALVIDYFTAVQEIARTPERSRPVLRLRTPSLASPSPSRDPTFWRRSTPA